MTQLRRSERASRTAARTSSGVVQRKPRAPIASAIAAMSTARYSPSRRRPSSPSTRVRNSVPNEWPARAICRRRITWKPWLSATTTVIFMSSCRAVISSMGLSR